MSQLKGTRWHPGVRQFLDPLDPLIQEMDAAKAAKKAEKRRALAERIVASVRADEARARERQRLEYEREDRLLEQRALAARPE